MPLAFWNNENPAVAAGKPSSLLAYEGDAPCDPAVCRHIDGQRWVPNAVILPMVLRNQ